MTQTVVTIKRAGMSCENGLTSQIDPVSPDPLQVATVFFICLQPWPLILKSSLQADSK